MSKSAFCICENKDADQLCSNCTTDQRLCFATQIELFRYFLNPKFPASSYLCWYSLVVSDLVGNPEDRFSCVVAHVLSYSFLI